MEANIAGKVYLRAPYPRFGRRRRLALCRLHRRHLCSHFPMLHFGRFPHRLPPRHRNFLCRRAPCSPELEIVLPGLVGELLLELVLFPVAHGALDRRGCLGSQGALGLLALDRRRTRPVAGRYNRHLLL